MLFRSVNIIEEGYGRLDSIPDNQEFYLAWNGNETYDPVISTQSFTWAELKYQVLPPSGNGKLRIKGINTP